MSSGQRADRKKHCGGIVVDQERIVIVAEGAELSEEGGDVVEALPALAGFGVDLQQRMALRDFRDGTRRRSGEDCAPEARVEDDTGGVDGAAEGALAGGVEPLLDQKEGSGEQGPGVGVMAVFPELIAEGVLRGTDGKGHLIAAVMLDQRLDGGVIEDAIGLGDQAEGIHGGMIPAFRITLADEVFSPRRHGVTEKNQLVVLRVSVSQW